MVLGDVVVERLLEPHEQPVRIAPAKELTSDNIPHPPLSIVLSCCVFNHARILTSGVYVYALESEAA